MDTRIRTFVAEVVAPQAAAMSRGEGPPPDQLVRAAGRARVAGLLVPTAFGGAGSTHAEFAGFIEAVARCCASSSVVLDVHISVASEPLLLFGTPEQRQRYLPRLASGDWTGAFALTEPSSGSDAAALSTTAVHDGDGWLLTGGKSFITNAGAASLYTVMARTGGPGARGVSAFLVESSWPGVTTGPPLHKLGLRGSSTAELVLDQVRVPGTNLLGEEGGGFRVAMAALDSGRVGISAQAVGIAQGALDAAVAVAGQRAGHGLPVDEVTLAQLAARIAASRALTGYAAALVDAGRPATRAASVAKLYATDTCMEVAAAAVDLCAPDSGDDGHPAAVAFRDAKACQIYEGTNQVQRVVIARELLRA
ncbi:MAG: acyl-CoA dehydrogenase family protein [Candidatus Dormibacteria bacterium]